MRKLLIAACVLAQPLVLAYMVYGRETVNAGGTTISIATAPIDTRDPFRGDFVRLRYGLNSLGYAPIRWTPADEQPRKGDKVYAVLQERSGGLHDVAYFTNIEPDNTSAALFLRGRLRTNSPGIARNRVDVSYGIGQLFVEQGLGIDIEQRQGVRGGLQTAMHAQMAVSPEGTAVLTGYAWNSLAIGIEIANDFALNRAAVTDDGSQPQALSDNATTTPTPTPLTLTLANTSNESVTLNNPEDNCGFHLEPVNHATSDYMEADGICVGLTDTAVTLIPGESLSLAVDLAKPRWHMSLPVNGETRTADVRSFFDNGEWFRLVYRSENQSVPAENAAAFWRGELISQAFNALGQID